MRVVLVDGATKGLMIGVVVLDDATKGSRIGVVVP
jgi:hypothetical protein